MTLRLEDGELIVSAGKENFEMPYKGSVEKTIKSYSKLFNPDTYYDMLVEYGIGWLEEISRTVNRVEKLEELVQISPKLKIKESV